MAFKSSICDNVLNAAILDRLSHMTAEATDLGREIARCVIDHIQDSYIQGQGIADRPDARISIREELYNFPTDTKTFLSLVKSAFTPEYIDHASRSMENFDEISGIPGLANFFIHEQTSVAWIEEIANGLSSRISAGEVRKGVIRQYDGSEDSPGALEQIISTSTAMDRSIEQIVIEGNTLREAWFNHPVMAALENAVISSANWTPSNLSGMDVFHGTTAHFNSGINFADMLSSNPKDLLRRQRNRNQMVPSSVAVIYTAFSPIRCFLWSVFKADPIQAIPGDGILARANDSFYSGGEQYHGVVLLQYHCNTPRPAGLQQAIIPAGKESTWFTRTQSLDTSSSVQWTQYSDFLAPGTSTEWPDVLHGKELSGGRSELRQYTSNYWRTVWISAQAEKALNDRHQKVFAIKINIVRPVHAVAQAIQTPKKEKSPVKKFLHKAKSTLSFRNK